MWVRVTASEGRGLMGGCWSAPEVLGHPPRAAALRSQLGWAAFAMDPLLANPHTVGSRTPQSYDHHFKCPPLPTLTQSFSPPCFLSPLLSPLAWPSPWPATPRIYKYFWRTPKY